MIKRPKPGEDEDDLLNMQKEFLREKQMHNIAPAAQVTNLRALEATKRPSSSDKGTRKPSKYAQSKGHKSQTEKRAKIENPSESVVGDIFEKNINKEQENLDSHLEDDSVYYPKVIPSLLGDIVEKNVDQDIELSADQMPLEGFPSANKNSFSNLVSTKNSCSVQSEKMQVDEPSSSNEAHIPNKLNFPSQSYILSSRETNDIHQDNVKLLSSLSETEILEEQKKLLSNLDPKLVQFMKHKRQKTTTSACSKISSDIAKINKNGCEENQETNEAKRNDQRQVEMSVTPTDYDSMWDNDILSHPDVDKWLHFESLEKDKLKWMKGIQESQKIKADEPYEARFDFTGYLLPYTIEYSEKTKTLFHHGDEPHRPGYSISELIELSRSSITQQRVMALNTIAGILEYYSAGTYKNVIEIPLTKLFFVVRIAVDENKVIILEPALKALRNLIYNRIDEASLDALIGFDEGNLQPCLENDKSEIEELESKESDLKDFHLAEIDIITALLRTDILQRLYYILETVRPSFNCVQYCLQILTRLVRDSLETAQRIVDTEHLINTLITNFLPNTSVNFVFDPQIVYNGKPVLAALKLFRILALQSQGISYSLVTKYDVLKPVSEYISSGVDRSYGLRIQIEAYCLLSNLLHFGIGTQNAVSLCPIIITALYKHVQGTGLLVQSSILSATHGSVVLQLLNIFLRCNLAGMVSNKTQIYTLLKEGVQKWIAQLSNMETYTCGHLRLLCSALDCCKTVMFIENIPIKVLNDSLKAFSQSQGFEILIKNLVTSSNLLSGLETRDLHLTKNLMSVGGTLIDSSQKVLPILNVLSPIPFLTSLFSVLTFSNDKETSELFLRPLVTYLKRIGNKVPSLCDNWFTRMEADFVFYIVKLSSQYEISEGSKDLIYIVANKLCYILRIDKKYELNFLFNNIVFNKHWFTAERLLHLVNLSDADGFSKALTSIEEIKMCYNSVVNMTYKDSAPNIVFRKWQEPILPRDWIYLPILTLYSKSQEADNMPKVVGEHAKRIAVLATAEKEFVLRCSLEWILFNELCFPDLLKDMDVTDRFCRIMCVFLCDNSLFLDSKIKILLQKCTQNLFKKKSKFNFDKHLTGLNNFQDFYTQFLEQFQSVSYGDSTFAACVLVPLAQKHDVKWRKLLWSEYAGCLRALDCPEDLLCYELKEYLYPEETDESLMRSYFQALSGNLLRPGTIAHKIATHHVECYRRRSVIKET